MFRICKWVNKINCYACLYKGSGSEVESDEEGLNSSQEADTSKQSEASKNNDGDDDDTSDDSDNDSEDSLDVVADKKVTFEDVVEQLTDAKVGGVKTPQDLVRNLVWMHCRPGVGYSITVSIRYCILKPFRQTRFK